MDERRVRPAMGRTSSRRDLGGMWRAVAGAAGGGGGTASPSAEADEHGGSQDDGGEGRGSDILEESIETAYRVLHQYLNQGERIAQRFAGMAPIPPAFSPPGGNELQARWLHASGELAADWLEMVTLASDAMASWAGVEGGEQGGGGGRGGRGGRGCDIEIVTDVISSQGARVKVKLFQGVETDQVGEAFAVHKQELESTIDVDFEAESATELVAKVRVPDGSTEGRYIGPILDVDDKETVGTVEILVGR